MIKLTITEKGGEARALSFEKDEVSVGRVQGNDIVLPKGNISKRHSKLSIANSRLWISDLKSTNGTYVNGRKIAESTVLRAGDKVFVGDFLIVIDPGAVGAETTGSRRALPPPPPAPPSRAAAPAEMASFESQPAVGDDDSADPARMGIGLARARPPAPPPPPPRRTIMNTALMGDGADVGGFDLAPPSPMEIESKLGDLGDVGDVGDVGEIGLSANDVAHVEALPHHGGENGEAVGEPESPADGEPATTPPTDGERPGGGQAHDQGHDQRDDQRDDQRHDEDSGRPDGEQAAVAAMFGSTHLTDEDAVFPADAPPATPIHSVGSSGSRHANGSDLALASEGAALRALSSPALHDFAAALVPEGAAAVPAGSEGQLLDELLLDPGVTTIVISPRGTAEVERLGQFVSVPLEGEGNSIAERVWQLANLAVPPPPSDNPVVDVRLPDGTRVTALFPPITPTSVCAVIRRSTQAELALGDVCANPDVEQIVTAALTSRRNLIVAGDAPSLMALASALAGALPAGRRVLVLGTGLKARTGWMELGVGHDPGALVRAATAFAAEHLFVVDPGGASLPDLLLAAARGQQGIIAAVAARSASEALTRLEAFCVGAVGAETFPALVLGTVDLVVFAAAGPEGTVRIREIAELRAEGHRLLPSFVVRRAAGTDPSAPLDVSGVSEHLAHSMAAVSAPLSPHLVRR